MDMPSARSFRDNYPDRDNEYNLRQQEQEHLKEINDNSDSDQTEIKRMDTRQTTGGYGESEGNAVDIDSALQKYESVRREMTRQSQRRPSAAGPSMGDASVAPDEEKGEQKEFDLTEFLTNQHSQIMDAGLKPKNMGVVWKDLTVQGLGADAKVIPTNFSVLSDFVQFWKWGKHKGHDFTILKDNNGFCKAGEMLLVLGRPGAGCTTLLRVIANMRASYTDIQGEVSYGGIEAKEFGKHFRGEVCYNEEEDLHYPTLTTKQTLRFALKNKTPGKRLPNESKGEFIDKILYLLGNMLGLTKQMDTMVGNAFVRGLSGGERKRLSIAEQMTTRSSINCWDCSTRGLDASSALDYVRSLRIMTDIFNKTTIATLYQASDSIFHLFDKVMVLDEGRVLYFGPTATAKQFFSDMGFYCPERKSTPDFLTGLCNMNERQVREGFDGKVPLNAVQFERQFQESQLYKDMLHERDEYENRINQDRPAEAFKQAFVEAHQKHAPKRSPFVATYYQQVKSLTIRQFQLIFGDKGALVSRYGGVVVKGLIMASCFFMMPTDASGAFSRGGAFLFSLLFNALIAQSELAAFMQGRRVLEKHKHYALYHPSAFYIATVVADIPLAIIQVLVFELCVYFMMGLVLEAGRFFTFMIILVVTNLCMNGFFRFWGSVSPTFFTASQLSSILLIACLIYCGYQIPYKQMHPWLFWIYWINPLAYGYKALLSNEMRNLQFSCEGASGVPYGPSYTDQQYRSCLLPGAQPGASYVLGDDYLEEVYGYYVWQRWINFVAVVLFFLFFTVITALAMEYVDLQKEGSVTKVYKRGCAPEAESDEKMMQQVATTDDQEMEAVSEGTTFSWHHIDYTVPVKGGTRQLLCDVGGIVKPGNLTALMGSSGAGKTTLLDVLARRKTIGKIEGNIYLNGEKLADDFERITGYCEQMDVHNPAATVREALRFSAYLRQPAEVPKEEKDEYVEQILELLEMSKIGDALVGDLEQGQGISVEERKRLTIATELVGKPKLLFLDEPTSGLDAQSSYNIVRFIRKLADAGWPVLCTIHQPSATLFEHFDHLLLLVRGGRTAYFGEIGKDSRTMIEYFERNNGPKCSPNANPAEYILECVGAGTAAKNSTQDWSEIWQTSPEAKRLEQELAEIHASTDHDTKRKVTTYALPLWQQLKLVYLRMNVSWWRCPTYNLGRLFNVCFIGLISGFSFWKLGNSPPDMQNRMFSVFTTLLMSNSLIILAQPRFMQERMWFRREYASKYYGWAPFALSCLLVEIPYLIVLGTIFLFCFYWTAGLQNDSSRIGFFYIHFIVFLFYSVSLGFTIAAFSSTPPMAAVINPFFTSILILFAGIVQPPSQMPHFWSAWMYWLDPYHYLIEGLVVNVMAGVPVQCSDSDYIVINAPSGQSCQDYMSEFFQSGGPGYLGNPDATGSCNYCQYSTGNDYFEERIGWSFSNRWRDFGILCAYTIFNCLAFIFFVFLFRKAKR
ncbi:ABC-2 type transporter-domain-containing protein [Gilbertella persicaria]|uniref:ABC-2 type transporter-domain-containing protein n=1 Tax=Gilbertella persicaria TaxID=101096 RepID=UPI0022212930|nr:ABC-2 type transporter-domain-containing protein [Gilbertella persicaria]KAI8051379.1 ABC-2 type transporter-domain-containing protein [Gilbertella persicaria]